ncbi:Uncharacterised protein [Chlamydia trachomatis]|nr:Uncharacterised protein [Chlamydia trachomatis]
MEASRRPIPDRAGDFPVRLLDRAVRDHVVPDADAQDRVGHHAVRRCRFRPPSDPVSVWWHACRSSEPSNGDRRFRLDHCAGHPGVGSSNDGGRNLTLADLRRGLHSLRRRRLPTTRGWRASTTADPDQSAHARERH